MREGEKLSVWRKFSNPQVTGEFLLLLLVAGFFLYFYLDSRSWPLGARLMPWISMIIGTPFLLIRLFVVIRYILSQGSSDFAGLRSEGAEAGRIMDLGFYLDEGARAAMRRLFLVCTSIVVLMLAIWVLGWHIALPTYVFIYLLTAGEMKWWHAGIAALAILALIVGLFDLVINAFWHEPLLFQWIGG